MTFVSHSDSYSGKLNNFQGKAIYVSKSKMKLGNWGSRLSEAQKKQVAARLRNRLEKTYVLTFDKEVSMFKEEEKIDALSGATDSWGKNFTPGAQFKNVKDSVLIQKQEFYGKNFLVKDRLQDISWEMTSETKKIGKYTCFKATAFVPTNELTWYDFSWSKLRKKKEATAEVEMTNVEAWYSLQIPVSHGPLEYWGLPGLILEVSAGNTTLLCSQLTLNMGQKEFDVIDAPTKGKEVTKSAYQNIVLTKMEEYRNNRAGRRR